VDKPRVLHAAEAPHYWIVDPDERLLLVHRWSRDGYTIVQRAAAGEVIRTEPFEAIELPVSAIFGDDEDEDD
jgi:Uma2 family endonuclease